MLSQASRLCLTLSMVFLGFFLQLNIKFLKFCICSFLTRFFPSYWHPPHVVRLSGIASGAKLCLEFVFLSIFSFAAYVPLCRFLLAFANSSVPFRCDSDFKKKSYKISLPDNCNERFSSKNHVNG